MDKNTIITSKVFLTWARARVATVCRAEERLVVALHRDTERKHGSKGNQLENTHKSMRNNMCLSKQTKTYHLGKWMVVVVEVE